MKRKFDTFKQMEYQSISDSEINNNSFKNETISLLSVQQLEHQLNLIIEHLDSKEKVDIDEEILSNFDSDCESFTIDKQYCEEFSDGESGKKDLEELLHDAQKIPNLILQFDPEDIELIGKDYRLKYQEATEQKPTASQNSLNSTITEDLRSILKLDPELKNYRSKFRFGNCFIRFIV